LVGGSGFKKDLPTKPTASLLFEFLTASSLQLNEFPIEAKIHYSKKTIVQASSVKSHLKTLGMNKSHTLISLDIESFYHLVMFPLVQKVVTFYTQKLPMKDKLMVRQCLKLSTSEWPIHSSNLAINTLNMTAMRLS
jgi:hypothetical protein